MSDDSPRGPAGAWAPARQRLVLLGASNLARNIGLVVDTARRTCGTPLEILAALGRGRSYGAESRFLGRTLPGICGCGLWAQLGRDPEHSAGVPISAIVTDIGNDIVYGRSVEQIAGFVEECLARLWAVNARVAVTRLPTGNLAALSERRFMFFRRIFFPRADLTLAEARRRVLALDARVVELAPRYGALVVEHDMGWYGLDPIHFRASRAKAAWGAFFGPLGGAPGVLDGKAGNAERLGARDHYRLLRMKPALSWRRGRVRYAAQPATVVGRDTTVSFY